MLFTNVVLSLFTGAVILIGLIVLMHIFTWFVELWIKRDPEVTAITVMGVIWLGISLAVYTNMAGSK